MSYRLGVTLEELIEFLNVAMAEGGCPAEQWALKAYETYKDLRAGGEIEEDVCCTPDD